MSSELISQLLSYLPQEGLLPKWLLLVSTPAHAPSYRGLTLALGIGNCSRQLNPNVLNAPLQQAHLLWPPRSRLVNCRDMLPGDLLMGGIQ